MHIMKKSKLFSLFAVCIAIMLFTTAIPGMTVNAATNYSGSGTKANPYLVQTVEQLQGMRDNLTAHYKLANTIDLSGVDFKPIGHLDGPFTGSFTCELDTNKKPKYVIKNLSVSVADTYNKDTYVANKGRMEAALFGATKGATITGIYVLDAKIVNKNLGDNTGALVYGNYKPGMDDMPTGILIGRAESTTVTNCGTTGVIDGRSNSCGGLIGQIKNSTVKNCYTTATVKSEGKWNIGGFAGSVEGGSSTISGCYSTGNVSGAQSNIGGFIGGASSSPTIVDCYATGNASGGRERKNSFVVMSDGESGSFKNCFALGTIDAAVEIKDNPITTSNCWVLSGKLHNTEQFTEGTLAQIKAAFAGQANWDTSGNQPQLKGIGVADAASKYTPGAVTGTTGTPGTGGTTTVAGGTVGGETAAVTPETVASLIEALPDPTEEGALTLEHKEAVKEAYAAYESLDASAKDEFNPELAAKLESARANMSILMVGDLVRSLKKLPAKDKLTPEYVDEIMELWSDYEFLDESVASEIDEELVKKLEDAHEYALNIKENGATYVNVTEAFTDWQRYMLYACAALLLTGMIFNIVMLIVLIRRTASPEKKAMRNVAKEAKKAAKAEKRKGE